MRYSNILIGQSDLVVAFGTRLGLQQTGFNWSSFAPIAKIIQVDIDKSELEKGHPVISEGFDVDATNCILRIDSQDTDTKIKEWIKFCRLVKKLLPTNEKINSVHEGYWSPYRFMAELSELATKNDVIVPCSSGGSFTSFYQSFANKIGQVIVSNKSLASMGYGLAGALGASLANLPMRTILVEGDGGFSQNLQELATLSVHNLNVKIFLMCNEGYASIRMTQKNYFDGAYLGCDTKTGLGFPDWQTLARAYNIGCSELLENEIKTESFLQHFNKPGPHIFIVRVHPEQTFFPKISSRINDQGSMESEPLWEISPRLPTDLQQQVFKYI
jgi:acetolactate synthase-1/2/3 large subunit